MPAPIRLISSMATRQLLEELLAAWPDPVEAIAVGGVEAAKRVRAGEAFDAVVLAANVIDELAAEGHVLGGSRVDIVRSGVAVAVAAGEPQPDIGSEEALKQAVLAAPSLGYSTGPSGTHLVKVFERWGIAETIKGRIVQAPPGVPVGSLVAKGEVGLGFQQLSELIHLPGITVVGPLPPGVQIITTFSGGVCRTSQQPEAVRRLLAFMAAPEAAAAKQRNGMEAA
jgi:molybdate transport system substrate-binding protein